MHSHLLLGQTAAHTTRHRGWIESPAFDLLFFILSPLLGFAIAIAGLQYAALVPAFLFGGTYLVGVPHYLATFAFFMGDENRGYSKNFWFLFYAGPILIFLSVTALYLMNTAYLVHAVLFVWNIYHVATQSAGILSLYRRLGGGVDAERVWAHRAILFTNAAMAFWYLDRFPPLWDVLVAVHGDLPDFVRFICLAAALACGVGYARKIRQRTFPLSIAEAAFLVSSLLLFTPYLWVANSNFATLAMLMGHYIQYLAIVWLLNRRKYRPLSGSRSQRWLGRISESWGVLAVFMLVTGLVFYGLDKGSRMLQIYVVFMVMFNSLALAHFYLDGLIWAFKNPFIRRTVGPFLTLDAHRVH
jgi:hypothetical protein